MNVPAITLLLETGSINSIGAAGFGQSRRAYLNCRPHPYCRTSLVKISSPSRSPHPGSPAPASAAAICEWLSDPVRWLKCLAPLILLSYDDV